MVQKFMVEMSGVGKIMVEKSGVEGPGLKLGFEKHRIEMSFNPPVSPQTVRSQLRSVTRNLTVLLQSSDSNNAVLKFVFQ